MKLHTSRTSPYARKVEILARLKGIELAYVPAVADGAKGYTGGRNPLGKIPLLEVFEDLVLFDSPVICEYLDQLKDPLLQKSGAERWRELRLHALGDGVSDAVYNYRFEVVRPDVLHWDSQILRHETAILAAVRHLETIAQTLGAPWTFGNIAIICALDYADFRAGHLNWRGTAPKLASWHAGFKADPLWKMTFAY